MVYVTVRTQLTGVSLGTTQGLSFATETGDQLRRYGEVLTYRVVPSQRSGGACQQLAAGVTKPDLSVCGFGFENGFSETPSQVLIYLLTHTSGPCIAPD